MSRATLALLSPLLPACGGGDGGGDIVVNLLGITPREGFLSSTGGTATAVDPFVGDNLLDTALRGFRSFDITPLPAGANIVSAVLQVNRSSVLGSPYANLGNVPVDRVDQGPSLDASDFAAASLSFNIGTLSTSPALGLRQPDVTARLIDDLANGRLRSEYRLRFDSGTDNDQMSDGALFDWSDPAPPPYPPPRP
jgi:hypothetical protein